MSSLHPVDFDALQRGTWIEPDVIEKAYQVERGTDDYRLAALRLSQEIESHTRIVCRTENGRVRLMTDAELLEWNGDQMQNGVKKMERAAGRTVLIRHDQLTDSQKRKAEFEAVTFGALASLARSKLRGDRRAFKAKEKARTLAWVPPPPEET